MRSPYSWDLHTDSLRHQWVPNHQCVWSIKDNPACKATALLSRAGATERQGGCVACPALSNLPKMLTPPLDWLPEVEPVSILNPISSFSDLASWSVGMRGGVEWIGQKGSTRGQTPVS